MGKPSDWVVSGAEIRNIYEEDGAARFIFKVEVGVARPLKRVGSVGGERRYGAAGASRSVG